MMKGKDEILNILVCSKNNRGIMALLHSAYGVRFLHTFRTVVQDDGLNKYIGIAALRSQ